eukprot:6202195-Pleurochrysis_carterae.AAC.2
MHDARVHSVSMFTYASSSCEYRDALSRHQESRGSRQSPDICSRNVRQPRSFGRGVGVYRTGWSARQHPHSVSAQVCMHATSTAMQGAKLLACTCRRRRTRSKTAWVDTAMAWRRSETTPMPVDEPLLADGRRQQRR